jgi:hypothetical protein
MCNARRRRPLWHLDRIGSQGGDASTTTPTTFISMFPLCDLQGYVDLISPDRCFASRRLDLGLFLFVFVGNFLFSMLRNPSPAVRIELNKGAGSDQKSSAAFSLHRLSSRHLCRLAFLKKQYMRVALGNGRFRRPPKA